MDQQSTEVRAGMGVGPLYALISEPVLRKVEISRTTAPDKNSLQCMVVKVICTSIDVECLGSYSAIMKNNWLRTSGMKKPPLFLVGSDLVGQSFFDVAELGLVCRQTLMNLICCSRLGSCRDNLFIALGMAPSAHQTRNEREICLRGLVGLVRD